MYSVVPVTWQAVAALDAAPDHMERLLGHRAHAGHSARPDPRSRRRWSPHDRSMIARAAARCRRSPRRSPRATATGCDRAARARHQHPGRAAALDREALVEDALQRIVVPPSSVVTDRPATFATGSRQESASSPSTITVRAAAALPAAGLGRPQPELLAQHVAHGRERTGHHLGRAPVELELEDLRRHRASSARRTNSSVMRRRYQALATSSVGSISAAAAAGSPASAPGERTGCGATPPSATRPRETATDTTAGEFAARRAQRRKTLSGSSSNETERTISSPGSNEDQKSSTGTVRDELDLGAEREQRHGDVAAHHEVAAHGGHVAKRRTADRAGRGRQRGDVVERGDGGEGRRRPEVGAAVGARPARVPRARGRRPRSVERAHVHGGHHGRAAAHDGDVPASSATACSAESGSRYCVITSPPPRSGRTCARETPPPRGSGRSLRRTGRGRRPAAARAR